MHRAALRAHLDRYAAAWPAEDELVHQFHGFVDAHPDCMSRRCIPGHITASAWILDALGEAVLLTHHKKLGRWLQLGGHIDADVGVERACLREAQEESGMNDFCFLRWRGHALTPLDLDVHDIPARGEEPAHLHWDVRFLLRADPGQELVISDESNRLEWAPSSALCDYTTEESVLRMHRKAAEVLS